MLELETAIGPVEDEGEDEEEDENEEDDDSSLVAPMSSRPVELLETSDPVEDASMRFSPVELELELPRSSTVTAALDVKLALCPPTLMTTVTPTPPVTAGGQAHTTVVCVHT